MDSISFVINDILFVLNRRNSNKIKHIYDYCGEYHINGFSFPIVSVNHFLKLLFSLEKKNA